MPNERALRTLPYDKKDFMEDHGKQLEDGCHWDRSGCDPCSSQDLKAQDPRNIHLLYIRFTWTQSTGEKKSDTMRKDNLRSLRTQNREIFTLNIRKPFTSGRFQAAIQETLRNLEAIHFSITFSIFNGSTVDRQISSSHRGNLAGSS